MPDNNHEGSMVDVVQEFHKKMDVGFRGLHEKMEAQNEKRVEADKVVTARLTAIEDTQKHLKVPVQPCAEMIALQNEKAETEKDVKDIKKSVVKEGAVWGFRGAVLFIMLKLGIDKWGG